MYGTRDAPMIWQEVQGLCYPSIVFQHETRDLLLCVHVDDLLRTGLREDLMRLKKQLQTMLMEEDDDMEQKAVYLCGALEWARTVLEFGRIGDICVHCCVNWEWKFVEASPRRRVPQWRREEFGVTVPR